MVYRYFSHNGTILPIDEATVPLSSVEYSYGFGVYETMRVSHGRLDFANQHMARLMKSAQAIGLDHSFTEAFVHSAVQELVVKNEADTCNLKILLIGGRTAEAANLYILCLNPLFPDRKLYSRGAATITHHYERPFPGAKTLNMLPSYLAYRAARQAGAYDALLINRQNCITEGTRTNFLAIKDKTIVTPPATEILPGVMRQAVLDCATKNGFEIIEQPIQLVSIADYDGAFLTSTSTKILPIKSINDHSWNAITPNLRELMRNFDAFLKTIDNPAAAV